MAGQDSLYNRVVALLGREWGIDPSDISPDDRLDERGDSLSMVNVLTAFEDEFQTPYPENQPTPATVAEFVETLRALLQNGTRIT